MTIGATGAIGGRGKDGRSPPRPLGIFSPRRMAINSRNDASKASGFRKSIHRRTRNVGGRNTFSNKIGMTRPFDPEGSDQIPMVRSRLGQSAARETFDRTMAI